MESNFSFRLSVYLCTVPPGYARGGEGRKRKGERTIRREGVKEKRKGKGK